MIRLYKNTTGTHNKWWAFDNQGLRVEFHWGPIGDSGTQKNKSFSYQSDASIYVNKKIREKVLSGYKLCCPWCKGTDILNSNRQRCNTCNHDLDNATVPFWGGHSNATPRTTYQNVVPKPAPVVAPVVTPKPTPVPAAVIEKKAKCGQCQHDYEMHVKGGQCAVCRICQKHISPQPESKGLDRFQLIELD